MPAAPRVLTMLLAAALLACGGEAAPATGESWVGTIIQRGDTTAVTTTSGAVHGVRTIDSIAVLLRGERLERPTMLAMVGPSTLAIADRERVHLVGTDGRDLGTRGRAGEGPGEFRRIGAIGGRGDSVVAVDRGSKVFAVFGPDGAVLRSGRLAEADGLANLRLGRVGVLGDTLVIGWGSRVSFSGDPNFGGVTRHLVSDESASTLAQVGGQPYVFNEEALSGARAELYGPTPLEAVGIDGRFALTDGVEYAVVVGGGGRVPMVIERTWQRIGVPASIREPDYDALVAASGEDPDFFQQFRLLLPGIAVGEARNSIEAIRFDRLGRLWVQVVDSLVSDVHPLLDPFAGELRATQVHWDIFDADGRLGWQLVLPASFTPWDATEGEVYGLYELPSGEIAVGSFLLE